MRKSMSRKVISLLMILCLVVTLFPGNAPIHAEEAASVSPAEPLETTTESTLQLASQCRILDHVDADVFAAGDHVARLPEEESLNSYVFLNSDGTKTAYYLDEPVKFIDSDGTVREKDLTLTAITAGDVSADAMDAGVSAGYITTQNDIQLTLPQQPGAGIRLSYNGKTVTILPQGGSSGVTAQQTENSIIYPNYYGRGVSLVYTPSLSGVKEDILLARYTGINSFTFLLQTNGLNLYQDNGCYYLAESQAATERFELGDVVAFDATGRFSVGTMTAETVLAGQSYRLTLTVDEEFLTDESTTYPVSIDPTVTISDNVDGAGAIEDTTIFSGAPNAKANWTYQHCGYYSSTYGVGRILTRINGDIFLCAADDLISAEFHIREATGTSALPIYLYVNTSSTVWTESGATWNNAGVQLGTRYATASAASNSDTVFDITDLVYAWIEGEYAVCGSFVLVSSNETNLDKAFYSSEFATTGYRPYVVISYDGVGGSMNYSTTDVDIGSTKQLTYTGVSGPITWTSSNTSVATVNSNGLVTGIKEGVVTITAHSSSGYWSSCVVYVTIADGVYKINNEYASAYLGMLNGQIGSDSRAVIEYYNTTSAYYLGFLWNIKHIGYGQYSFRPLLHEDFVLYPNVSSNYLSLDRVSSDSNLTSLCKWTIDPNGGGYSIRNASNSYGICSPASGNQAEIAQHDSSDDHFQWYLTPVSASSIPVIIMFFDTTTGWLNVSSNAASSISCELETNTAYTLSQRDLEMYICNKTGTSQSTYWSASNSNVASVNSANGTISVHGYGESTVTVTHNYSGGTRTVSFNIYVPLTDSVYTIQNRVSGKYIEIVFSDNDEILDGSNTVGQMSSDNHNAQRWHITRLDNNVYTIRTALAADQQYYLGVSGNSGASNQQVVLCTGEITDGMKWKVDTSENGGLLFRPLTGLAYNYVLASDNGFLLKQTQYDEDNSEQFEWVITTTRTFNLLVYFDPTYQMRFDSGYAAVNTITEQLDALHDFYWENFGLYVTYTTPTVYDTYATENCITSPTGSCNHGTCSNSESQTSLSDYHHTNIHNILMRLPLPSGDIDATILYIGHTTCEAVWNEENQEFEDRINPYNGLTYIDDRIIGITNNLTQIEGTRVLVHEFGHLFDAPDHYDNEEDDDDIPTTDQINAEVGEMIFNEHCIYGEDRFNTDVEEDLLICEGCSDRIEVGITAYYD